MNNTKLTNKEIDLIDNVRQEINLVLCKDFSQSGAEKLYELIKILINSRCDNCSLRNSYTEHI